MLPRRNGWSVMSELRRQLDTPVIFLSARDAVPDRIKGLELGADDYLLKPFAFSELLARIRTVLRRGPVQQAASLRVGDLELDLVRHQAWRGGQQLVLTAKEFSLLALMSRRQGEVLTRTQIAELVWGIHFHSDSNVVDVAIGRLRRNVWTNALRHHDGRGNWPPWALAFGGILNRLKESVARLQQFSADLAHELRTPIQNLMLETEVTLARVRTETEYQEGLIHNLEELQRLAFMVEMPLQERRRQNL